MNLFNLASDGNLSLQFSIEKPPIAAFQTEPFDENYKWKCYGEVQPLVRFNGRYLQIEAKGLVTLEFWT